MTNSEKWDIEIWQVAEIVGYKLLKQFKFIDLSPTSIIYFINHFLSVPN